MNSKYVGSTPENGKACLQIFEGSGRRTLNISATKASAGKSFRSAHGTGRRRTARSLRRRGYWRRKRGWCPCPHWAGLVLPLLPMRMPMEDIAAPLASMWTTPNRFVAGISSRSGVRSVFCDPAPTIFLGRHTRGYGAQKAYSLFHIPLAHGQGKIQNGFGFDRE